MSMVIWRHRRNNIEYQAGWRHQLATMAMAIIWRNNENNISINGINESRIEIMSIMA
jgi:hypothetical protein